MLARNGKFPTPSRKKELEHIATRFIKDQDERMKQLEDYVHKIATVFMKLVEAVEEVINGRTNENKKRLKKKKNHWIPMR